MFSGLRLRLTLLYTLAALALVALVGIGSYIVVARYFQGVTDLALQHKMTHEFHALAAPIPDELIPADRDWSLVRGDASLLPQSGDTAGISQDQAVSIAAAYLGGGNPERIELKEERGLWFYQVYFAGGAKIMVDRDSGRILVPEREDEHSERGESEHRDLPALTPTPEATAFETLTYDAELAAIFVLPLDVNANVLFNPNASTPPIDPDKTALQAAIANGSDLRTVTTSDGQHVRLLTYRLTRSDGPIALQLGRVLNDQELVLGQLTIGLLVLGTISMLLVGAASWLLAGRALRPAQDAWEHQQRFIASASHELRTPLTLIRASTEVALRGIPSDDTDQRELLGDVLSESDHMRRLVDDLLILSRLDSGRLPLNISTVELPNLLAEIQRQTSRLGDEREVRVALESIAGQVRADPDRLRQVLLILIDNALRHTPAGGQITLTTVPRERGIRIDVSDTGCGIAPEHLPHIFERFYRADPARGREGGNAGLGLSIAKGLIGAMSGQIGADSTVGRGTTIWIVLPTV